MIQRRPPRPLRVRLQLTLGWLSVGMAWLVLQGATLDPISDGHPSAFYLGWSLGHQALLWLLPGLTAIICGVAGTRRAVDWGFIALMLMPAQRASAWAWSGLMAVIDSDWHGAMSSAVIAGFWATLLAIVYYAGAVPSDVGLTRPEAD